MRKASGQQGKKCQLFIFEQAIILAEKTENYSVTSKINPANPPAPLTYWATFQVITNHYEDNDI